MAKRRLQLNLRGFQVFEAVARHMSVTQAAVELGITQSAVSHQLRHLAEYLGEDLIDRQGRSIALTEAGARLAEALDGAFDLIERSTASAIGLHRRTVRVGLYSSFAAGWMIPALPDFLGEHPDVDLQLVLIADPPEIGDRMADVFITSEPPRRGYWSVTLFPEVLLPVAHPDFHIGFDRPLPLITSEIEAAARGSEWEIFASANGLDPSMIRQGEWLCCSHYLLAMEMARAGLGAALIPDFLALPVVARGELVQLPGTGMPTGLCYDLQVKYERRDEPDIRRLTTWMRAQARRRNMNSHHAST